MNAIQILLKMHKGWTLRYHFSYPAVLEQGTTQERLDDERFNVLLDQGFILPTHNYYDEWIITVKGYKYLVDELLKLP